ncbi:small multidrug efflux protein [uncultured Microbacterium sp.]|uniref:small multidrug efflux protein n=1 Tax=Microbacterium algeriense TaxID=2615184 RepID=UPI0025945090|nr:small multidrug efflux protein [uncultured Microbacterium sp.]
MNLIETFQNLVAQVPELVQPLIVALAGAVPFVEGEGAVSIGIIGGIAPVVAAIAAMVGNFLCVMVLVLASSGARAAVVNRSRAKQVALAGGGTGTETEPAPDAGRGSARREKFQRAFERYGVPGVSLLGPLLLPTQFTATMLAASGIGKGRILFWQALAIIGWTTIVAFIVGSAVYAIS